jgi:hypothetical protein
VCMRVCVCVCVREREDMCGVLVEGKEGFKVPEELGWWQRLQWRQ